MKNGPRSPRARCLACQPLSTRRLTSHFAINGVRSAGPAVAAIGGNGSPSNSRCKLSKRPGSTSLLAATSFQKSSGAGTGIAALHPGANPGADRRRQSYRVFSGMKKPRASRSGDAHRTEEIAPWRSEYSYHNASSRSIHRTGRKQEAPFRCRAGFRTENKPWMNCPTGC